MSKKKKCFVISYIPEIINPSLLQRLPINEKDFGIIMKFNDFHDDDIKSNFCFKLLIKIVLKVFVL